MNLTRMFLCSVVLFGLVSVVSSQPMIIAHRGASFDAPENTLAAVKMAWQQGADAVEVDVHLSADNKIMVIHDKDTRRTSGTDLKVKETISNELRKLDVGSFKSSKYTGERIPFLEEIIETIPKGKMLFVEIKSDESMLPVLKKLIEKSGKTGQIVIIGFDFATVEEAKSMMPDIPVYWLKFSFIRYSGGIIERVKEAGLDGLNLHHKNISGKFASKVKKAGLGLYTWTVDDPMEAKRLQDLGIDGITTNRPLWLMQKMNE